jgi:hypothetical protein
VLDLSHITVPLKTKNSKLKPAKSDKESFLRLSSHSFVSPKMQRADEGLGRGMRSGILLWCVIEFIRQPENAMGRRGMDSFLAIEKLTVPASL